MTFLPRKFGILPHLLLSILLLFTSTSLLAGMTLGEAINKAGRQRMLSQRITKAYALVGQDLFVMTAEVQLSDAIALFEQQLAELTAFAKTAEEKKSIQQVAKLWEPYRKLATTMPDRKQAIELTRLSEAVLKEAHEFVGLLEKRSTTKVGMLVNLSGRQRMLTQRMGKFYALMNWGIKNPAYTEAYSTAVSEFSNALYALKSAPENTPEIRDALEQVDARWRMFKLGNQTTSQKPVPGLVIGSLDKILELMNEITGMYAALPVWNDAQAVTGN